MNEEDLSKLLDDSLADFLDTNKKEESTKEIKKKKKKTKPKQPQTDKELDESINKFFDDLDAKVKKGELLVPPSDFEPSNSNINESVPMIFDMMQSLLSKELLLPALNDLFPKFTDWLEKNSPTLNESDKDRYQKQLVVIKQMIENFEDDSISDNQRFESNMDLMEKMQSYGSPPDELVVPNNNLTQCSII